jgi:hypothetical protein
VYIDDYVVGGLSDDTTRTRSDRSGQCRNSDAAVHGDSTSGQYADSYTVAVTITIGVTATNIYLHHGSDIDADCHRDTDRDTEASGA